MRRRCTSIVAPRYDFKVYVGYIYVYIYIYIYTYRSPIAQPITHYVLLILSIVQFYLGIMN